MGGLGDFLERKFIAGGGFYPMPSVDKEAFFNFPLVIQHNTKWNKR